MANAIRPSLLNIPNPVAVGRQSGSTEYPDIVEDSSDDEAKPEASGFERTSSAKSAKMPGAPVAGAGLKKPQQGVCRLERIFNKLKK